MVIFLAFSILGCQTHSVGSEPDIDSGFDASIQYDVEIWLDSQPQLDASVQNDAVIQFDSSTIPNHLTYAVDSKNKPGSLISPWWDKGMNDFTYLHLYGGSKDITVQSITFILNGTSDLYDFDNIQIEDSNFGLIAQQPNWNGQYLSFSNLNLAIPANQTVSLILLGRPNDALCKSASFDIQFDTDIEATTDDDGLPVNITESATSIIPSTVLIQGMMSYLYIFSPSGQIATGNDRLMLEIVVLSTFDLMISETLMKIDIDPQISITYFDDFKLWMGNQVVTSSIVPGSCNGNVCDLRFYDDYILQGNCQQTSISLTADIDVIPESTIAQIEVLTKDWEVVDISSADIYLPEYLPDSVQSASLLFGP